MNSPRSRALPTLLLSTLLALPAAAVWAVPSYNLAAGGTRMPQPYHGEKCQAPDAAHQETLDEKRVSFERLHSPCRLEDSEAEKGTRANDGQEDPAETLRKVEDWDSLNKHPGEPEHELGLHHLQMGHPGSEDHAKASVLDVTMAPVPEPETYAMLLGGLGLLAARALLRRRASGRSPARKAPPAARQ